MTQAKSKLIIPVGIPGCGKSTWGETFVASSNGVVNGVVVSSDEIRQSFVDAGELNSVGDQNKNTDVFKVFHDEIARLLSSRRTVYADATNLDRFARQKLLQLATDAPVPVSVHLVIFADISAAFRRNATRDRVVPNDVMLRMLNKYERFRMLLNTEDDLYQTVTEISRF